MVPMQYETCLGPYNYRISRKAVDSELWSVIRWPATDTAYLATRAQTLTEDGEWFMTTFTTAPEFMTMQDVLEVIQPRLTFGRNQGTISPSQQGAPVEQLAYMKKYVTIQPSRQGDRGYIATIRLLRMLTGFGLKEAKDVVDSGKTMEYWTTIDEPALIRMLDNERRGGAVAAYTTDEPPPFTLKDAYGQAHLVTMDGLLPSVIDDEHEGTLQFETVADDGLGYAATFMADTPITLNEGGSADVADINGNLWQLTFYVPMKR